MKSGGALALGTASWLLALGASVLVWALVHQQGRSLNELEQEHVVALPGIASATLLLMVAVQRLGPRPFLVFLWLGSGALAAHTAYAFLEVGLFYLPAAVLMALAVLLVRPAKSGTRPQ